MRIHRLVAALSISILTTLAQASWGQETDELDYWIPSFGVYMGALQQNVDGIAQSTVRPPADPNNDPPDDPTIPGTPITGSSTVLDPDVGLELELMSPGAKFLPGSPRLFVRGRVANIFGVEYKTVEEKSPGNLVFPDNIDIEATAVSGQGTRGTYESDALSFGASAGVAFTTEWMGRRLRWKPSFEYMRHSVTAKGALKHLCTSATPGCLVSDREFLLLKREENRRLDSIGGGLELEMDTLRAGPFVISVFLNGQVYRLLSDPDIEMSASLDGDSVIWSFEIDRTLYRGTIGARFRLVPNE